MSGGGPYNPTFIIKRSVLAENGKKGNENAVSVSSFDEDVLLLTRMKELGLGLSDEDLGNVVVGGGNGLNHSAFGGMTDGNDNGNDAYGMGGGLAGVVGGMAGINGMGMGIGNKPGPTATSLSAQQQSNLRMHHQKFLKHQQVHMRSEEIGGLPSTSSFVSEDSASTQSYYLQSLLRQHLPSTSHPNSPVITKSNAISSPFAQQQQQQHNRHQQHSQQLPLSLPAASTALMTSQISANGNNGLLLTQQQLNNLQAVAKGYTAIPPPGYICKLCFVEGHWLKNCTLYKEKHLSSSSSNTTNNGANNGAVNGSGHMLASMQNGGGVNANGTGTPAFGSVKRGPNNAAYMDFNGRISPTAPAAAAGLLGGNGGSNKISQVSYHHQPSAFQTQQQMPHSNVYNPHSHQQYQQQQQFPQQQSMHQQQQQQQQGTAARTSTPPEGYICRKCNVPGHWIQQCPLHALTLQLTQQQQQIQQQSNQAHIQQQQQQQQQQLQQQQQQLASNAFLQQQLQLQQQQQQALKHTHTHNHHQQHMINNASFVPNFSHTQTQHQHQNQNQQQQNHQAQISGPPPDSYVCKICAVPGHWIWACPLKGMQNQNQNQNQQNQKPSAPAGAGHHVPSYLLM
jgi:hypothetical protein